MLDRWAVKVVRYPLKVMAAAADRLSLSANQITVSGFLIGVIAFVAIAMEAYLVGLVFIALNRIADGLDGALARRHGITDAGGFLDISLDFLFYAMIPLAFVIADPVANGVAGGVLLTTFIGTGTSFLAFASLAGKHGIENPVYENKSIYYLGGIAEGTETITCFVLFCLFPALFAEIAYLFAALCLITIVSRIYYGFRTLKAINQ
ncbi:CDP-alcohol phosphatidyltransferase family protein [Thaumasiovibrio subtropicus]|uniref:CDP-alcohol phosphatidyltransferase family protein n=1 Tax=Thaumasiovibrio subtropicus TaxID=1891207 RepID=UPI000B35B3B3|nr:CDP-alcohol phosphatidyltransferase family protein [Thaumasiovibrio subtropicus]